MKTGQKKFFENNPEALKEMFKLRKEGWSLLKLGLRYGLNHTSIMHQLEKHSVPKVLPSKVIKQTKQDIVDKWGFKSKAIEVTQPEKKNPGHSYAEYVKKEYGTTLREWKNKQWNFPKRLWDNKLNEKMPFNTPIFNRNKKTPKREPL
jgi:hypothetical protein